MPSRSAHPSSTARRAHLRAGKRAPRARCARGRDERRALARRRPVSAHCPLQCSPTSRRGRAGWSQTTCSSRDETCINPGNPASCTPCENGLCTGDPCGDINTPSSCGARRCANGVSASALADDVRWAPLLPQELDGIDDPNDPNDDDVPSVTVSLVDGARRYLDQKFGPDSDQLQQFEARGAAHGVTPNLDP